MFYVRVAFLLLDLSLTVAVAVVQEYVKTADAASGKLLSDLKTITDRLAESDEESPDADLDEA